MNKTKLKRVLYVIASSILIPLAIMFLLYLYWLLGSYEGKWYAVFASMYVKVGTMIVIIPYNIIGIILALSIPVKEKKATVKEAENEFKSNLDKTNINSEENTLVTENKVEKIEKPNENIKFYNKKATKIGITIFCIILGIYLIAVLNSQGQKSELMEQVKNDKIPDKIMDKLKSEEESNGLKKGSYFKSFKIKEDTIRKEPVSIVFEIVVNGNSENDDGMYLTIYCDKKWEKTDGINKVPKLYIDNVYPHDKIWNEMKQLKGQNNGKSSK